MKAKPSQAPSSTPIAIIGMGCLFAQSSGLKPYWRLLYHGLDAIDEIPASHWSAADYFDADPKKPDHVYCKRGGFLSPISFDPTEFGIPPSTLEATDTSQLLGLVAAKMALTDAGYGEPDQMIKERTGVILGVTGTQELVIPLSSRLGHPIWRRALEGAGIAPEKTEAVITEIGNAYVSWQENSFPGLLGNVVAGRISSRLDLGGTNCVVDAACASSMGAIHLSTMELISGHSDLMVTGGIDTLNDIFMHMCFSKSRVLSASGDAKPFSKHADGTVLGEGIGLLVLKRLADAKKDNDRIYAVIKGVGSSSDGKSQSIYAPRKEGQIKALEMAYKKAGIRPQTVELVEAHGTGTRVGDRIEFEALCHVFEADKKSKKTHTSRCALGSVKSMIGHTKAAAGSAGMIKTALSLYNKVLPPTLKADEPDPELRLHESPFYLNPKTRPWFSKNGHPRRAGVSAFGFGGSNFHMVLEEYDARKKLPSWDGSVEIFAFSAPSSTELTNKIENATSHLLKDTSDTQAAALAATSRRDFTSTHDQRMLIIWENGLDKHRTEKDLPFIFENAVRLIRQGRPADPHLEQTLFYGHGPCAGKTAFLFPGQGSQYADMGRDLVCTFPEAMQILEKADNRFNSDIALYNHIFPLPQTVDPHKALQQTDIAQPAIGAVSLAMLRVLERFGVSADATCGHSFGELSALCAAGWLTEDAFFDLSILRGKYIAAATKSPKDDAGAMLAVSAPIEEFDALLEKIGPEVILANRNGPKQGVLSGPGPAIDRAEDACRKMGFSAVRLPVAAAFHSPLVKAAQKPFAKALKPIHLIPTAVPVLSNTTGAPYPTDVEAAKQVLGEQLIHPVNFLGQIEHLYQSGVRTFVEVGPRRILTGLVKAILGKRPGAAFAVDESSGKRFGVADLGKTLCRLAAGGHTVDLRAWETPQPASARKQIMQIPILGANYRAPITSTSSKASPQVKTPTEKQTYTQTPLTVPGTQPIKTQPITKKKGPVAASASQPPPRTQRNKSVHMTVKNSSVTDAFQVVEQGLKSMQALQKETAEAHKKFLETQSTASQTLQQMMAQTQRLTEIALGVETPLEVPTDTLQAQPAVIPEPAAVPVFAAPAPTVERPAPVIQSVQSKPESPTPSRSAPPASVPPAAPPEPGNTPEATPRESTAPRQDIQGHILEVVSSLTGYPQEMLGMDMDIESDLGIDSIKRVEILSTLEEKVSGLPAISPEIMGSLKTLGQIAQYLTPAETAAPAEAKQSEPAAPAPPPQASDETDLVERKVISLQGTHLKKKPEINIPPDRRIYILKDETGLSDALVDTFTNLGLDAASVSLKSLSSVKKRPLACGLLIPYAGLPKKPLQAAFKLARRFGRELMESARSGGAFFGAVTRMDGGFGFKQTGFDDPLQGGLAGLVKTAALEWDGVCCRIFDLAPNWRDIPQAAQAICTSLLQPPGEQPVEIGLDPDLAPDMAHTLDLVPSAYPQGDLNVTPEDVFLITGGARGVTAAAAHALAAAAKPTLILLGRSPTPTPEPEWLLPLQDEGAIKKQLLQNQTDPKSMSPRDLETLYKQHMANREILKNLSDLNQTGATAVYYSVDVCDAKEVCEIVRATSSRYGQVTGIIHGAGVLEDRLIVDKTDDQFKRVLKTKVDGLSNLLKAVKGMDLKYLILFSSIAARMGNRGQADYAMANEVLNKTARMEAFNRTACRVISVNWGPWDGGMVTPALKREFAQRDIKLIPIKAGARSLLQEMRGEPGGDVEVVIGGNLQHALLAQTDTRTESIKKTAAPVFTLTSQRELVIEDYPILKSHMLDRKPVVPFALCAEWLGHSALHGNPGLVLQGFNDMRLFNGIVLDGAPKTIRFMAGKIQPNHTAYHVEVQIRDGVPNGEDILHYGATAILSERLTDPPEFKIPVDISSAPYSRSLQEVYDKILFHGHDLQGIQAISSLSPRGMIAKLSAAPAPEKWMSNPPRSAWIADPLILDAAFQMATLWCYEQKGMVSLPSYASAFRRYQNRFPSAGVTAVLDVREASDYKLKGDLTFIGPDDKVVARLSGYEAIMDASLYKAFKPDAAK